SIAREDGRKRPLGRTMDARKRAYAGNSGGPGSPPSRGRADLGSFLRRLRDRAGSSVACVRLPACNGTPVHAFTTLRRAPAAAPALPEGGCPIARAPGPQNRGGGGGPPRPSQA